jgi:hypothetical protein
MNLSFGAATAVYRSLAIAPKDRVLHHAAAWSMPMSTDFAGPPPPRSSLGAWLLSQVQELAASVAALVVGQTEQQRNNDALEATIRSLKADVERARKVQNAQGIEIESIKTNLSKVKKQIHGLKISRGHYKAKAEKIIDSIERRLN